MMQEVLAILEPLVALGETSRRDYALLFDRVAVREGRLQRYGTQFLCVDGHAVMEPVEDPEGLDARRAEMGLGSVEEDQAWVDEACGATDPERACQG